MIHLLKTTFSKEIRSIRNLIRVAFSNGKISQEELAVLNAELNYLHLSPIDDSQKSIRLEGALTRNNFFQFRLVYELTQQLMSQNVLSAQKEKILKALISVFEKSARRVNELLSFVQYNIRSGYSYEDAFRRLGYQMYLNRRVYD